ncbi:MAG: 23S rRNA (adenine(2503)-C(2))-methyltransferase RlmN [Tissierellia bacterium]|nr:23S rRNA (adenine(2503)-C(2))-methyltransferase RlmN [Tissierellia bacterium]
MKDTIYLDSLPLKELQTLVLEAGLEKFRAKQIFQSLHKHRNTSIKDIKGLSARDLNWLENEYALTEISIAHVVRSNKDGTEKFLFRLEDENLIEAVYMPYKDRTSLCISSQVGCNMGCVFCASTKGGKARNLSAGEMVRQLYSIEEVTQSSINNIVVMGQGEPLENYTPLVHFLKIVSDPDGANKSLRKITVSTCGLTDKIYALAEEGLPVTLAVSLHRTTDESRTALMPINRKYPLKELLQSIKYYKDTTGRRVSFEYMVIGGENDSLEDAKRLKNMVKYTEAHVNILKLNPIEEYVLKGDPMAAEKFCKTLHSIGVYATFRKSMGQDIEGACGQLRRKFKAGDLKQ